MMKKPHALLLPLVLLGLLLATGAGWLVSRPLVQQIPGRPSRVQVTPYQLTSTANNLTTRGMSFTPVDPTHPRVNLTITKDQAVLLCFHEQPELNQAIHYSTQLGMLTSTLHLDSVQDRLAWMITFHVREEISSGPPGSIHVIAEHFTVMFIDATTGQPVISFPFVEVTTIPPVPANTPQPTLTPPPAAASQAAFTAILEPAVTPSPLPTSSATPLPLPVPYSTRTLTPTMTVTVVPTTVVLDNGLTWTECVVPNREYGIGPDEEILTRCAPKPIWGAADQQRMGQRKETRPNAFDLQITIGSDSYETRLVNGETEHCCRYQLIKNGTSILEVKADMGVVDPNRNFWNIGGKFVWEIANAPSLMIVDGVNLNDRYGWEASYFPYEIKGNMIYIARKDGKYRVIYHEKPIGPEFDRISMPYCCGLTRLLYGSGQYWFVGSHDGRMVLVSIAVAGNDFGAGSPPAALQPPLKQTALAEYQSKRATDIALHPPIIKNEKTPLAGFVLPESCPRTMDQSKTGIMDFSFGPFPGGRYLINWAAAYGSNGDFYNIWAGSPDDDPQKGLLRVGDALYDSCLAYAKGTPSPGFKDYLTERGPMKITEIKGDTVVYSIEGGGTGAFNFVTGQFLP